VAAALLSREALVNASSHQEICNCLHSWHLRQVEVFKVEAFKVDLVEESKVELQQRQLSP